MRVEVEGRYYYSPCSNCKERECYSCLLRKYQEDAEKAREGLRSAEFRIEQELEPRIKAEKQSYDRFVTTDPRIEWEDCFGFKVDELVDMFDEEFIEQFDFDGDDIASKIAKLIMTEKEGGRA